ncbi:16405_t:CDS:2 [Acaulospora morrowiae]|uniref:16405_t:CDS:1 n=1 Tax=Acaulospora morrowiae TaxID=94023 RepID=A0A9N8V318_9GLOM|nr:16405_t:CDS:2 [Acaulospora morrowiae]
MAAEAQNNNTRITAGGKDKLVVDREKTVPFLLRMFWRQGNHHRPDDYTPEHLPTENEVQIYTWKDATLKEIANLFREVNGEANQPNARLSFKLVYVDNLRGKYTFKDLGMVHNLTSSSEDGTNLDDARFVIGDFLDVAIFYGPPPRSIERRNSLARDRNRDRLIEIEGMKGGMVEALGIEGDKFYLNFFLNVSDLLKLYYQTQCFGFL